jgi:rhomboid family GlyGly-CTERM serine protease
MQGEAAMSSITVASTDPDGRGTCNARPLFHNLLSGIPAPITLVIVGLSGLLMLSPGASTWLQFDSGAVAAGQWWRIVTGHVTHWNLDHLFWDGAVFAVLGVLCERRNRVCFFVGLLAAAVLIPLSVWLLSPEMQTYRGLSGLDTGLFTMLAVWTLAEKWRAGQWYWVTLLLGLLAGLVVKIGFETFTGGTMFVDAATANFQPVPLAHVVGAAVGIVVAVLAAFQHLGVNSRRRRPTRGFRSG